MTVRRNPSSSARRRGRRSRLIALLPAMLTALVATHATILLVPASPASAATSKTAAAPPTGRAPRPSGATTSAAPLSTISLHFDQIATATAPSDLTSRTGSPLLYVSERSGTIRTVDPATGAVSAPLIDLSADLATDGERGLLGLTFSPDGSLLYVSFNPADGNSGIDEFTMSGNIVLANSRRTVIRVTQPPEGNHKGGHIAFGPDGMLWWGLGDGGGQGDPYANGQNLNTLLAGMVRIDPSGRAQGGYTVPADNPWAAGGGAPEKWLEGLRNPWRFSFDRTSGDLWIGDVGQDAWEEVDFLPAPTRGRGANLGWSLREGTHQ